MVGNGRADWSVLFFELARSPVANGNGDRNVLICGSADCLFLDALSHNRIVGFVPERVAPARQLHCLRGVMVDSELHSVARLREHLSSYDRRFAPGLSRNAVDSDGRLDGARCDSILRRAENRAIEGILTCSGTKV